MPAKLRPAADYWDETSFDRFGLPPGGLFLNLKDTAATFAVTPGRVRQWADESWWEPRFRCVEGWNVVAIFWARMRNAQRQFNDPLEIYFELPSGYAERGVFA